MRKYLGYQKYAEIDITWVVSYGVNRIWIVKDEIIGQISKLYSFFQWNVLRYYLLYKYNSIFSTVRHVELLNAIKCFIIK